MTEPREPLAFPDEVQAWFAWKRVFEKTRAAMLESVCTVHGLTEAELDVLLVLDAAGGTVRQNRVAAELGWTAPRLSHQLTRMEARGLLARKRVDGGIELNMSKAGNAVALKMRPLHAYAVRQLFGEPLGDTGLRELAEVVDVLGRAAHSATRGIVWPSQSLPGDRQLEHVSDDAVHVKPRQKRPPEATGPRDPN